MMHTDIRSLVDKTEDGFPDLLDQLRRDARPIILLGVGQLGALFYDRLIGQGLVIDTLAVHRRYWTPGQEFRGRPVLPLDEALSQHSGANVLCALQFQESTRKIKDEVLATGRVHRVYLYDTGCTHWGMQPLSRDFLDEHHESLDWLYDELSDEWSKKTLVAFLNQRISGAPGFLEQVYDARHLFPQEIIQLSSQEIFMDCGAFDGASIHTFCDAMRMAGLPIQQPIYAWEPDPINRRHLAKKCRDLTSLIIIPHGAWKERGCLYFSSGGGATSRLGAIGDIQVEVDTIDHILDGRPVTYLKMDIEGAEHEALQGAQMSIARWRPKLAVCVYHQPLDIVRIPRLIRSLQTDYRFYLRAHSFGANDVVLYAV